MATDSATPSVMLNFGSSSDSWDDRELVNAYDAALTEFHVSWVRDDDLVPVAPLALDRSGAMLVEVCRRAPPPAQTLLTSIAALGIYRCCGTLLVADISPLFPSARPVMTAP